MSNKDRVWVQVHHRDEFSKGPANREKLGHGIYHWAILVSPKDMSDTADCTTMEVTNGVHQEPGERKDLNPNREWRFRRQDVNPLSTGHFLGAVMIGKVPVGTSVQQVQAVLEKIAIPKNGQGPDQNCVTWIQQAIVALQEAGLAEKEDVGGFMSIAFDLGGKILDKKTPLDLAHRFVNGTTRPM